MSIDKMSELLLHENLGKSAEDAEVRKIARVRTLTVLSKLDASPKRSAMQFLYESDLINKSRSSSETECVVHLLATDRDRSLGADLIGLRFISFLPAFNVSYCERTPFPAFLPQEKEINEREYKIKSATQEHTASPSLSRM